MNVMRAWTIGLAVIIAGVSAGPAFATIHTFNFALESSQESPSPCGSATGSGFATVTLDDVTGDVTVSGTFSNLSSNATACHIHGPAPAGMNASPIVTLSCTAATSGTITGGGTFTAGQVADMINGLHYVNLHSGLCSGGEIRGQVLSPNPPIPASSEWAMIIMGAAFLGVGVVVIRRGRVAAARIG